MRQLLWLLFPVLAFACDSASVSNVLLGPSGRGQDARPTPAPAPTPTPTPTPEPAPVPGPVPVPVPTPTPDEGDIPEDIPDNSNPVAGVVAKLYHIECAGQLAEVAAVGCRLHLDATPVDAYGKHTQSRFGVSWSAEGPVRSDGGGAFTPAYRALATGEATFVAIVDGVFSNPVRVSIR